MEAIQKPIREKDNQINNGLLGKALAAARTGAVSLMIAFAPMQDTGVSAAKIGFNIAEVTDIDCSENNTPMYGQENMRYRHTRLEISEDILKLVTDAIHKNKIKNTIESLTKLVLGGVDEINHKDLIALWKTVDKNLQIWQNDGGIKFRIVLPSVDPGVVEKSLANQRSNRGKGNGIIGITSCSIMAKKSGVATIWGGEHEIAKGAGVELRVSGINKPGKSSVGFGAKFAARGLVLNDKQTVMLVVDVDGNDVPFVWELDIKSGHRGVVMSISGNAIGLPKYMK